MTRTRVTTRRLVSVQHAKAEEEPEDEEGEGELDEEVTKLVESGGEDA